jgi:hypothetical protein
MGCSACGARSHTSRQDWPPSYLFPPRLSQRAAAHTRLRTMHRPNRVGGAARKGMANFGTAGYITWKGSSCQAYYCVHKYYTPST